MRKCRHRRSKPNTDRQTDTCLCKHKSKCVRVWNGKDSIERKFQKQFADMFRLFWCRTVEFLFSHRQTNIAVNELPKPYWFTTLFCTCKIQNERYNHIISNENINSYPRQSHTTCREAERKTMPHQIECNTTQLEFRKFFI